MSGCRRIPALVLWLAAWCPAPLAGGSEFVGSARCADCHQQQYQLWRDSHHDLAMQVASAATVLGDFGDAEFSYFGERSRFYRRDGGFFVKTRDGSGEQREFEVLYTFGVEPLQQYLVALPGGRLQALTIAWDSRPRAEGGQRWFHLQPDEAIAPADELHWSGTYFNWNSRCAECHSTGLQKNFSLAQNRFDTTWAEIDVACEACHGAGAGHLAWAALPAAERSAGDKGLRSLRRAGVWEYIDGLSTASLSKTPAQAATASAAAQLDSCAHCHSRRNITSADVFGKPFLDHHALQLLDRGIYHADGQILEEVFVYGSFIQSKMFHQGVVCSDCHEPHSLALRQPGNAVCGQCHNPAVFDTPKHHHHLAGGAGAVCADCHMPETTYMVVDPRRDHSLRVPRPDLSVSLGVPNACNQCHTGKPPSWAAAAVAAWYPDSRLRGPHFGTALAAGHSGEPRAAALLAQLAAADQPDIARATALSLLQHYPGRQSLDAALASLGDGSSLVRAAALQALQMLPLQQRFQFAGALLGDSSARVRAEAGRLLAGVPTETLTAAQKKRLQAAVKTYVDSLLVNADLADSHLNLAALYRQQGRWQQAQAALQTALKVDPRSVAAMVNLADWYRQTGRDEQGEALLQKALRSSPHNPLVHHSLGLLYVRQKQLPRALQQLQKAAELAPQISRYAYVYSVALDSTGATAKALEVAQQALQRQPADPQLRALQASLQRKLGR